MWAGAALALLLAIGLVFWLDSGEGTSAPPAAGGASPAAGPARFFGPVSDSGLATPGEHAERRRQLVENVQLTDHSYCSYLAASKYPMDSRPAAQNPDQLHPSQPVTEMNAMRLEGGGNSANVFLQTSQSQVYLAAGEAAAFSLRAVDAQGATVPIVITRALAQGMTYGASRPTQQLVLSFSDDGGGADPVAGDNAWAGILAPGQTGLAGFHGTIRTEVRYTAGGRQGFALFDVIYTPVLPAAWTGKVREALENGSLNFHLGLDVRQPGRYIVTGRVDDANGKPFAVLTFNEVLGVGVRDVTLTVFGKLLTDERPALPLRLRDVDGYLLRENVDPDRLLLPRREGRVFASRLRTLEGVSNAQWQSEERTRYLDEYAKDRKAARERLAAFDPGQPLPAEGCAPGTQ